MIFHRITIEFIFSQKKFLTHLFSVISSSEIKYSKTLQVKFSQVFDKYVDENNTYEILESMILDSFPSTNNGNSFLNDFIKELKCKGKFIENAENLFKKIKDKEVILFPSFWNIFSCDIVKKYFNNDDNKIAYLFALKFSKSSSMVSKVDTITIKPVINTKSQKFILKLFQFHKKSNIYSETVHIVDVNEDGIPDIIVRNKDGKNVIVNGYTIGLSNYPYRYSSIHFNNGTLKRPAPLIPNNGGFDPTTLGLILSFNLFAALPILLMTPPTLPTTKSPA